MGLREWLGEDPAGVVDRSEYHRHGLCVLGVFGAVPPGTSLRFGRARKGRGPDAAAPDCPGERTGSPPRRGS